MNVTAQKLQSQYALVRKPSARSNHRTTLPQSRPLGVTAPSEREPGGLAPFTRVLANIRGYGRFSSPLRNSENITLYHSTKDTPSVTPVGRASSLREGAGRGAYHSTYRPEGGRFRAIFIAPTKGVCVHCPRCRILTLRNSRCNQSHTKSHL